MPARTTTFDFFCVATSHPKDPPPHFPLPHSSHHRTSFNPNKIHSEPNPMQSTGLISTNAKNTKAKSKVKAKSVRENRSKQRERKTRERSKGKTPQNAAKELPQSRSWTPPRGRSDGNCKKTSITIMNRKKNTHTENVEKNVICLRGWTTMVLYGATTLSVCLPFNLFYSIYVEVYWFVCQCKMIFGIWNLRVPHHFATGVSRKSAPRRSPDYLLLLCLSDCLPCLSVCLSFEVW